jgi:hypothetical protein
MEGISGTTLMICSQTEFDPFGPLNPNISAALDLKEPIPGFFSDDAVFEQYVDQFGSMVADMYARLDPDSTVNSSGEKRLINEKEYLVIMMQATLGELSIYQDQYYTQLTEGVLIITASYYDEANKSLADAFMQSIVYE